MSDYPMVEQINLLIGNRLAAGGELFLPGVGSLYTERQGARRRSKRLVEPPCRRVFFSSQQRGESLPTLIARAASCDETAAQEIYARWLERTFADGVLTVGGVGVLKNKHFAMEEAFDRRLNPQGHEPLKIRLLHRFDWALWFGVAAIVFAAVFGGYQFLMLYPADPAGQIAVAEADPNPLATPSLTQTDAVGKDDFAGPSEPEAAGRMESGQADAQTASGAAEERTGSAGTAVGPDVSGSDAKSASQPDGERQSAAQPASAQRSDARPSGTPQSATQQSAGQTVVATRPESLASGRKYVVLGVFSTPENAARAAKKAASNTPAMSCRVYRFGEKFMVSPFESDDAAACAAFIREHRGSYRDLWTYTAR